MANVLKMATVADIVTLIKAGHSDRRISAVLSLDRGTIASTGGFNGAVLSRGRRQLADAADLKN